MTALKRGWALSEINELLELLEDDKWHDLSVVAERMRLHEFRVELIVSFLAEYEFVSLDKEDRRIRLTPSVLRFLEEIKAIEKRESVGQ